MNQNFVLIIILTFLLPRILFGQETCGRIAYINYQEVMVDASSGQKGEGLRYYVNKDPIAKSYLDEYQSKNSFKWQTAAIGTVGSLMLVTGIFKVSSSDRSGMDRIKDQKFWLIGGSGLIAFNILLTRALESSNEDLLQKSVEEYNKRNLPRIYLTPFISDTGNGVMTGLSKEF